MGLDIAYRQGQSGALQQPAGCVERYEGRDAEERAAAQADLRRALEPPRVRLLTQFTTIPNGVKFLVDLRAELLALRNESA